MTANPYSAVFASRRQVAGLDEDDAWRALLVTCTGKSSLRTMTAAEIRKILDRLHTMGASSVASPRPGIAQDNRPQARKVRALWWALWELGEARSPSDEAMVAYVKRQTGRDAMRWNSADDLRRAIDCLNAWCSRVGYQVRPYHAEMRTPGEGLYEPVLIEAQWARLVALETFKVGSHAGLDTWMHREGFHVSAPQFLDREDAQEVVRRLGKWLRRITRARPEQEEGADG